MPPIYQALRVVSDGFVVPNPVNVILEVQQHLGEGRVRTVAMEATDGMVRGMKAIDLGSPITLLSAKRPWAASSMLSVSLSTGSVPSAKSAHAHPSPRSAL